MWSTTLGESPYSKSALWLFDFLCLEIPELICLIISTFQASTLLWFWALACVPPSHNYSYNLVTNLIVLISLLLEYLLDFGWSSSLFFVNYKIYLFWFGNLKSSVSYTYEASFSTIIIERIFFSSSLYFFFLLKVVFYFV